MYVAEKMFRPAPEYTRFSVRNIDVWSSVGSSAAELVAILRAATPGMTTDGAFVPFGDDVFVREDVAVEAAGEGAVTEELAGGAVAAGFVGPPKSWLYA